MTSPAPAPSVFRFEGSGWGHGVGMSQRGAAGQAAAGASYREVLAWYYPGTDLVTAPSPSDLRVLLAQGLTSVTVSAPTALSLRTASGSATVPANTPVRVEYGATGLRAGPLTGDTVTVDADTPVTVDATGRRYLHGQILIRRSNSTLAVLAVGLSMDRYLYGLGEMPSSWPAQALAAQAVAARSYATYALGTTARDTRWFDLYASTRHQAYIGYDKEDEGRWSDAWRRAVDTTSGQVVTHSGRVANTVYSASSGGHTESAAYVWGSPVPYLVDRPDPHDGFGPNPDRAWSRTVTAADLGRALAVGDAISVTVTGQGPSGRLDRARIAVTGTAGRVTVTGTELRSRLAAAGVDLRSTRFAVTGPHR